MPGLFISYRREDTPGQAGRLYDRLRAHFGRDRVFMDVAGIKPGVDFPQRGPYAWAPFCSRITAPWPKAVSKLADRAPSV